MVDSVEDQNGRTTVGGFIVIQWTTMDWLIFIALARMESIFDTNMDSNTVNHNVLTYFHSACKNGIVRIGWFCWFEGFEYGRTTGLIF